MFSWIFQSPGCVLVCITYKQTETFKLSAKNLKYWVEGLKYLDDFLITALGQVFYLKYSSDHSKHSIEFIDLFNQVIHLVRCFICSTDYLKDFAACFCYV